MMELIGTGVLAGVLGTVTMDALNRLFADAGILARIDVAMLGRLAAGWRRGRARYGQPSDVEPVTHERVYGYVTHYAIGVGFAVAYVVAWGLFVGGPPSPWWALVYGLATTGASYCFVFPSMGLGIFGRRSPEGLRAPLSSLANHLFYGAGLAVGIALW
jgi:hypothetical protein